MKSKSGRKEMQDFQIFINPQRREILFAIANKPKSISDLEKELKINRGTLKHHIKVLENRKFIKKQEHKNETGKPVYIHLIKTDWSDWAVDIQTEMQDAIKKLEKKISN